MNVKLSVLVIGISLAALTGCQTQNAYTGESQTSNATTIGAISALVCGAIGASKSSKRARNAAVGCGLIGAGVGHYMDVQEQALREELEGSGVRVAREGDNIRLIMPSNITFATNEFSIQSSFFSTLKSVAKVLEEFKESKLLVAGHTDSTGSRTYNYDLSIKRADSVGDYLISQGLKRERVLVRGFGPDKPVASNESAEGRAQNRRVEVLIEPKADQ